MLCSRLLKLPFRVGTAIILELDELWHELPQWRACGVDEFDRPEKPVEFCLERIANDNSVHGKSSSPLLYHVMRAGGNAYGRKPSRLLPGHFLALQHAVYLLQLVGGFVL